MVDSNVFSGFLFFLYHAVRACRWLGIGWWLLAEHLFGMICASGVLITILADKLEDELPYLVNALWDLAVDPTMTG